MSIGVTTFAIGKRLPSPFDRPGEGARIVLDSAGLVRIFIQFDHLTAGEIMDIKSAPIETGVMCNDRYWIGFMRMGSLTQQFYYDATKRVGDLPSREKSAHIFAVENSDLTLKAIRSADLPGQFLDSWIASIEAFERNKDGYEDGYARFCDLIDSMELPAVWDACQKTGVA